MSDYPRKTFAYLTSEDRKKKIKLLNQKSDVDKILEADLKKIINQEGFEILRRQDPASEKLFPDKCLEYTYIKTGLPQNDMILLDREQIKVTDNIFNDQSLKFFQDNLGIIKNYIEKNDVTCIKVSLPVDILDTIRYGLTSAVGKTKGSRGHMEVLVINKFKNIIYVFEPYGSFKHQGFDNDAVAIRNNKKDPCKLNQLRQEIKEYKESPSEILEYVDITKLENMLENMIQFDEKKELENHRQKISELYSSLFNNVKKIYIDAINKIPLIFNIDNVYIEGRQNEEYWLGPQYYMEGPMCSRISDIFVCIALTYKHKTPEELIEMFKLKNGDKYIVSLAFYQMCDNFYSQSDKEKYLKNVEEFDKHLKRGIELIESNRDDDYLESIEYDIL